MDDKNIKNKSLSEYSFDYRNYTPTKSIDKSNLQKNNNTKSKTTDKYSSEMPKNKISSDFIDYMDEIYEQHADLDRNSSLQNNQPMTLQHEYSTSNRSSIKNIIISIVILVFTIIALSVFISYINSKY